MDDELEAMLVEAYQRGWREGCETLLEDEEREGVSAMPHKDAMGEGCGTFMMEISPRLTRIASRLEADEVTPPMIDAALEAWDASDGDDRGRMWNAIERALEARAAILAMRRAAQE